MSQPSVPGDRLNLPLNTNFVSRTRQGSKSEAGLAFKVNVEHGKGPYCFCLNRAGPRHANCTSTPGYRLIISRKTQQQSTACKSLRCKSGTNTLRQIPTV